MSMSVDQMIDILSDMFKEIDKETLFLILQSNKYDLDITLETLMTMEGSNTPQNNNNNNNNNRNERPNQNSNNSNNNNNNNNNNKKNNKRGSNIQLPDDFLRVPGYQEKQKEYVETGSLLNLLADPIFLQELEREFGPNYQSVLREHLQAEALRTTVDRAPYSDRPTNQNQIPSAPRHFYVQPIPDSSHLPQSPGAPQYYSHQYYNNVPPPYSHSNVSVGQQQPAVLAHQNQTPTSSSPPSSTSTSSSWFFSPPASTQRTVDPSNTNNSQNSNTSTATTNGTIVGFGGGSQPPPRDDGPSISDRFQSILKSFTSTFNSNDTSKKGENRQLLGQNDYDDDDNDDGEEGVWEGGIQMETRQNRSHSESANL